MIALFGIRIAGPADHGSQPRVRHRGRGKLFSPEPAHICTVQSSPVPPRTGAVPYLILRIERRNTPIHQHIENDAKRININRIVILSTLIDFGRHILQGPDAAHSHPLVDGIHLSGNAEVAEFEARKVAVKQISRLDIPVQDIASLTYAQGAADLGPEPDHILF